MDRLAEEISRLEESPKALSWQTIQQWENGTTAPKRKRLEVVAQLLGMTAAELMGEGTSKSADIDLDQHPELSPIRSVSLKLQAGISGFAVEPVDEDDPPIFFRNDWLRERGYKPYELLTLRVKGMSMITALWPDDRIVVNTGDTQPLEGEAYAINYEGEGVIKRLKRDRGTWWLTSDNPDKTRYPDKECLDGSCIIVGRIIHKQSERI